MKEAFELLDTAAKKMGLTVDEFTTNYSVAGHGRALVLQKLTIQEYTFERIHQFVYLDSFLTNDNGISSWLKQDFVLPVTFIVGYRDIYGSGYYQGETKLCYTKLLPIQHGNFPL
jgi:hypothetical protein